MAHFKIFPVGVSLVISHPMYEHDCDTCHFLGNYTCDGDMRDVYLHDCDGETTLIVRDSDYGGDYRSMSPDFARAAADALRDDSWKSAVELLDAWNANGKPELDLLQSGDHFFTHFTQALCVSREDEGSEGQTGVRTYVYGLSSKVTPDHAAHFVGVRHPRTHCQHEHDCCGGVYAGRVEWSFIPDTEQRAILVKVHWHTNI